MSVVSKIKLWRKDPVQFVRDNFEVTPDEWQIDALNAFVSDDLNKLRISLQACAGPGKSAVLAWCAWLFLSCYGEIGEHPKGAAISVTEENLKDNLWVELSKWQQKSPFLRETFTWSKTRIFAKEHPETWFLSARSYPKSANKEELGKTLSGIHSKFVLFIIDESGAIPVEVVKAAEQAVGEVLQRKGFVKIMQAGNPLTTDGMLYAASNDKDWFVIRITGDPLDPKRSPRINLDWAKGQIEKYGRDDPWVMAYILGHFPKSAINTLLSISEVEEAMRRTVSEDRYSWSQKRLGVDVARFGMDDTVIFPRQGLASFNYATMRKANSNEIASRVAKAKGDWGSEMEFIDGTGGYGSGVVDSLMVSGFTPQEIHFSSKANDSKYYNKRAEMWFLMADWIRRGGCLPNDPRLLKELSAPTYSFKNGKFLLESKEQIKKRLGFSTDCSDALALTFAMPDMPSAGLYSNLMTSKKNYTSDYDPFDQSRN